MRRLLLVPVVALMLLGGVLLAPAALANNPHFTSASGYIQDDAVHVIFTEVGLGNETQVHEVLTVDAACETGGGNDASTQTLVASGDFAVVDGEVAGSLSTAAVSCPPGQEVEIYHHYSVTDTTNQVTVDLSGFVAR
jgi:hypothetical protein